MTQHTPQDRELDDLLYEMLPCISCGIDADPADGFGNCTCGNEKRRYQAKQALLDWHNKQVEALLDRLEAQWGETIDNTLGEPIRIKFVSVSAIQAERAKLKEVK